MKRLTYSLTLALAAAAVAAQQPAPAPKREEYKAPARMWHGSLGVYEALTGNAAAFAANESSAKPRKNPWDAPYHNVDDLFGLSEAETSTRPAAKVDGAGAGYLAPSPFQERDFKSRFTNPPPGVFTRPAIPGSVQTPSSEESRQGTNLFAPVKKLLDKTLAPAAGSTDGGKS